MTVVLPLTRREEIVEEAARLFKQKGFAATTMREIAEQVGMEAASMYNHIKGKDELLRDICFRVADAYQTRMNEISNLSMSTMEALRHIIRSHIDIICQDVNGVFVANQEWRHLSEPAQSEYKQARDLYEQKMLRVLEDGMREGVLRTLPTPIVLYTILSALRWLEVAYRPGKEWQPEILEDTISEVILQGIVQH